MNHCPFNESQWGWQSLIPSASEPVDLSFWVCQYIGQILPFSKKPNIDLWESTPFPSYRYWMVNRIEPEEMCGQRERERWHWTKVFCSTWTHEVESWKAEMILMQQFNEILVTHIRANKRDYGKAFSGNTLLFSGSQNSQKLSSYFSHLTSLSPSDSAFLDGFIKWLRKRRGGDWGGEEIKWFTLMSPVNSVLPINK